MNKVTVTVPATTANIGVGFDCLGAALTMANKFQFVVVDTNTKLKIMVEGTEAYKVGLGDGNLLYRSLLELYHKIGQTPPNLEITIELGVPLSRGLGSSATAIVGGLLGGNSLAGNPLSQAEIMEMAIALEGHPDNVVPALKGNCLLSVEDNGAWQIATIPWHQDIIPIVAIPNFELSTREARAVLPREYTRSDVIFDVSRMGLLIEALKTNNASWLKTALADRMHQPYRQRLIKGYQEIRQAAIAAGAYGVVISGAGPTLLALTNSQQVERVISSMKTVWNSVGVRSQIEALEIDRHGAKVV